MVEYDKFRERFNITASVNDRADVNSLPDWIHSIQGIERLLPLAGSTFDYGLYRIPTLEKMLRWTNVIGQLNSKYSNKAFCFAYDWWGRIFAVMPQPTDYLIWMIDPATGQDYKMVSNLAHFHDVDLVEEGDNVLDKSMFTEWYKQSHCNLQLHECVGFRIPLFLGGKDVISNMEVTDMDVYWSFNMQMLSQLIR